MSFLYAIVLTGGIATGKSSVAEVFGDFGFEVVDADEVAHKILDKQANRISKIFGAKYLLGDGRVDRKTLGSLVFTNRSKREQLEGLLHPLIRDELKSIASKLDKDKKPYLIDIPLFFESNSYEIERSIVVYASRDIQLERLMQRDSYSRHEAMIRIESQMDIEQKRDRATYVIDNGSTKEHLRDECLRVRDLILIEN
jgi:dephospho-CoA kinase